MTHMCTWWKKCTTSSTSTYKIDCQCKSVTRLGFHWNTSTTIELIVMTCCTDVHDFQRMNSKGFYDPLTLHLVPPECPNVQLSSFSISTRLIARWFLLIFMVPRRLIILTLASLWLVKCMIVSEMYWQPFVRLLEIWYTRSRLHRGEF